MTIVKGRRWVAAAVVILIAGTGWFGVREYRCKVRGAAFTRQVETIKRDAALELRVGTNKAEVARFFAVHSIPFAVLETEAYGSLRMLGCAPLGCGTDRAFIGVRVEFDAAGTVTGPPKVFGMYQDCL
jgi:hypothetical protein